MWIDDVILSRSEEPQVISSWVPESTMLVVGNANDIELECNAAHCAQDGVPILRRCGGGGAVVLHSGVVVLSVGLWVKHHFKNDHYFALLNGSLAAAIHKLTPQLPAIGQRGISDLAIGDRKIVGTSMFRSRNYLLYQASILADAKPALLERYLRHPSKEPDYRKRRGHGAFVVGLKDFDSSLNPQKISEALPSIVCDEMMAFSEEWTSPVADQVQSLRARACLSR